MSEVRAPPPGVDEEEARPVSQRPSTSSARMQQEQPPFLEAGDVGSPDSVSSSADVDIMREDDEAASSRVEAGRGVVASSSSRRPAPPPRRRRAVGGEQARALSQQPATSSARMQQEPLPLLEAGDDGSADSVSSSVDTEIMSYSAAAASAARSRPWSPQPSTSTARVQPKLQPFVKAGKTTWSDQVPSGGAQNFRSSWTDRERRPWSPQPSTSSAAIMMERDMQPFLKPDDLTGDHMYARDLSIRRAPMGAWESRTSSPQPSTSTAGMQFEMQPFVRASDAKPADSTDSNLQSAQNISSPWGRMRHWSPTPLTSSAAMMLELELMPVNTEGGDSTSTDSIYSRLARNISAPLGVPWTPQGTPTPEEEEPFTLQPSEIPVISLDDVTGEMVPTTVQSIDYSTRRDDRDISIPVSKRLRRWSTSELRPPTSPSEASSLDSGGQNTSAPLLKGQLRRWPPQQLTTAEEREMRALTEAGAGGATSADSDLSCVAQNLSIPAGEGKKRPWSPQPSTSRAALMQLKLMPLMEAIDSKADSFSLSVVQNISALVEERNLRPLSPQPSTSSAPMQPVEAGDEKPADAGASSTPQASGSAGEGNAPPPPEPSTSTAGTMEVSLPPVKKAAPKNPANSVYAHVPHNIRLRFCGNQRKVFRRSGASTVMGNMGMLITLASAVQRATAAPPAGQADRHYGRLGMVVPCYGCDSQDISKTLWNTRAVARGERSSEPVPKYVTVLRRSSQDVADCRVITLFITMKKNKMNEKYGPVIEYIAPMVAEEKAKQQTQQILIASALDHFANTINQIADKYEGKVDTTGFTERLEEFKKRMEDRREKRRKRNPNATEEPVPRPPSPPKLSDEEINRRLREETEAAVEALLTGDRSKECPPDRFAEIIKSFQEALNPRSK